jgi:hypothetical protein
MRRRERTKREETKVQLLIGLLGGLIGSIAGGGLTWLTTRWTLRRELEHSYDKELRSERVTAYKQLWQATGALPRYQWPGKTTRSELRDLMARFHSWYFEVGGLFFSQQTKDAYFDMMNALDTAAGRQIGDDTEIEDDAYANLFSVGEKLRLHLAADIGASLRPQVPSVQLRPAPNPPELNS